MTTHPRVAVVILLLAVLLMAIPPARAQTEAPSGVDIHLRDIEATLTAGGSQPLRAELHLEAGDTARDGLRLVTTVYARSATPAELNAAFTEGAQRVFSSTAGDLADLPAGASRVITVTVDPAELDLDTEDAAGVYPVEFGVFQGADPVGAVTTALVVLPEDGPPPLPITLVAPLAGSSVPMGDDDVAPLSALAMIAPDGPMVASSRDLADIAIDGSAAGTTVQVDGRILADVNEIADGFTGPDGTVHDSASRVARRAATVLDRLRELTSRADVSVIASPYGPADLVALVRGGQASDATALVRTGREAVTDVIDATPDAGVIVPPDGINAATVAALSDLESYSLLLDEAYLAVADPGASQPVRRLRTAGGGEVPVLVPDQALSDLLVDTRRDGIAATAQRLRADTALRWLNADGDAATAVLLRPQDGEPVEEGMLAAVQAVMTDASWLRPVSLGTLASSVRPSDRVVRLAYPPRAQAAELDQDYITTLGMAREALVPMEALLPEDDGAASAFGRSLRSAAAIAYRDPDARVEGLARVRDVLGTVESLTSAVTVIEGPPVTLTATTGEIPVVLVNSAEADLRVRVRVGSTGFEFEEDAVDLVLPAETAQTLTFTATARNPGAIAGVGVSVEDPTGQLLLVTSTLAVRSTAFPVVALVATIGGGAVLLLWGLREGRRRRAEAAAGRANDHESAA